MKSHLFGLGLAALIALGGCKKPNPIKVGEFTSLTGANSTFGLSADNGSHLAVAEINAAGGVLGRPLELIVKDTRSDVTETTTVVQELIAQDKVVALLGEVASSRSLAAAPLAQQHSIPMITPASTNEKVTETGDYIFRACFVDSFQGKVISKFARSIDVKRVAVLVDGSKDYSLGLAESFKNDFVPNGGTIISEQRYTENQKDFTEQLKEIKQQNPEAIFMPNYYTEAPLIMEQARKAGIDVPFMGTDGWNSPQLLAVGGAAVEGSYFSGHFSVENEVPKVRQFVKNYQAKYTSMPDDIAALAYDSVYLLADAIKRAQTTEGPKLRDALAGTQNFIGVTGGITFDATRNPTKAAVIIRVQDNSFRYLETVDP